MTSTPTRRAAAGLLCMLVAGCTASNAWAQVWPTGTVKIIVPFTPGTGMDTIARAVAPRLAERLGQAVIVQNQPGANGNIGADQVAKATDGHTVLMGANTMVMAAQMVKSVAFDPIKDFAPVTMAAWGTLMMVASPKSNITSMADLIAQAKARPGHISYGSPGVGTPHHMAMELFKVQSKLFMLHVPYRGSAGYVQDLLSGELHTGFLPVHVAAGFVNSGRLVALAVDSNKRHPVAPKVATFGEQGVAGVDVDLWYAFFLPSRAPASHVDRLNTELVTLLKQADIKDLLGKAGMDATSSTPAELAAVVGNDHPRWGAVIKRNGLTAE